MTSPIAPITNGKVKDDYLHQVGDVEVRLPSLSYLRPGLVRQLRRLGEVDALYTLLELSLPAEALAAVDAMDPDEHTAMLDGWRRHSGLGLGES